MNRLKADRIRAEVSLDGETKTMALIIALLESLYSDMGRKRILKTVCFHFGLSILE